MERPHQTAAQVREKDKKFAAEVRLFDLVELGPPLSACSIETGSSSAGHRACA